MIALNTYVGYWPDALDRARSPVNDAPMLVTALRSVRITGIGDLCIGRAWLRAMVVRTHVCCSQRAVMGLMVWSNNAMTKRYQHLTPGLRRDIARQVDELLWTNSRTDETTNHR